MGKRPGLPLAMDTSKAVSSLSRVFSDGASFLSCVHDYDFRRLMSFVFFLDTTFAVRGERCSFGGL